MTNVKFLISNKKKGQLLVETIIGIGVVAILLSAIIPLYIVGVKGGSESWKADLGRMLLEEESDGANALSRENWNNLYRVNKGTPYHVENAAGRWVILPGAEEIPFNNVSFSRSLIVDNVSRTGVNGAGELETTYNASRDDPSTQKITVTVSWPGSAGIQEIDYFSRFSNSLWEQTTWPAGTYTSKNQIDTAVAGTLQLAKIPGGGTSNYGNRFVSDSLTTIYRLNNQQYRIAMRFTAQKSGNVNQLRVYIAAQSRGNQVFYRYGLQDNNPITGNPSGSFISSATANFSSTGWQIVNLPSPAVVTAGNVYHLVIQYDSGSPGSPPAANRYIDIRATSPKNGLVPYSMLDDSSSNTLRFNGALWALQGQQPLYVLGFDDATFEGNPFDNRQNRSIYGNNIIEGEKFTLTTAKEISGVGLYLAMNSNNPPNDNLYVTLKDLTTNSTLANEAFIDPLSVGTVFAWKSHNFSSTINLAMNHQFSLTFSSPGSGSNRTYLISNLSNPNDNTYNGINWDGINSIVTRSSNGGGLFTDYPFIELSYYLISTASEVYAPWGELISNTYDTGNPQGGGFNRLSWATVGALPAHTTIKMQLAANSDNSTWSFTGPNGANTWYTASIGENIWTGLYSATAPQPARYLRYKIRLETTDNMVTPIVDWARINWSK